MRPRLSLDRLFTIPLALLFSAAALLFGFQLADRIGKGLTLADGSLLDALDLTAVTFYWAMQLFFLLVRHPVRRRAQGVLPFLTALAALLAPALALGLRR